jgi:imidazolonepropionase-like amidohydrolase
MLVLRGRMISALSDSALENGLVAAEGGSILYAGSEAGFTVPEDAETVDAGNGTILPGFTDCHAHLTGGEDAGDFADGRMFGDQIIGAAYQAGLILDAGFTGLRDMSEAGFYISRGTERGAIRGPRIVPGGKVLSISSGHVDLDPGMSKAELALHDHLGLLVDGPDDCVRGVREQFRMGAKFIKICATGGVSSPTDRVDDVQFSEEELRAIVGEARRHHTYVCAHCTGNEGAYRALLAGVTCIEHGVMLTQREIDLMAEMDATLVTTLSVSLGVAAMTGFPDWMHKKALLCAEANINTIAMARKAGIRIALGTDYSNSKNTPYLQLGKEFAAMTKAGMTPMEAIKAGTIHAAHLMMTDGRTGALEAGRLADIAVTDGNPLHDISCLTEAAHIRLVVKGGKIEKNTLEAKGV